ncbi:MAG TPA: polysaccharide biosynthesis/export family protein [Vicinamibacterales bacterium]|nr:polysaccharide biosynthesis/export family protein [Vicinamibacterales bacterium]
MKPLIRTLFPVSLAILLSAAVAAQAQKPAASTAPVGTTGTTAEPPAATGGAAVASDYRLVSGDKLRIEVYKDPQLSQSLQIRPDGKITLPLVGDIPAAGKTPTELREVLTTALTEYNKNPFVTVIVVETMPQVVHVVGEVNSPGAQPIHGQMTVLQALAAAGGFKDFAKTKDIRIQRQTANGVTVLKFNYKDAINGRGKTLYVQPGDTIIVP